jgi:glucosamine-phosphate N-acetyltransferase
MLRKLVKEDYHKGFIDLINYFTKDIRKQSYKEFEKIFDLLNGCVILVIEKDNKIIGTAKIIIEQKFHNNFSKVGHIEDVVVSEEYRGKGYGTLLIKKLIEIGNESECYKTILSCSDGNILYYEKLGFKIKGKEMSIYF